MTLFQWVLLIAAFLLIGSLMTVVSSVFGLLILGQDGRERCIGRVYTLDSHYGTIRFMQHMAAWTFLSLSSVLLSTGLSEPAHFFQGTSLFVWPVLSIVSAGFGVLSILAETVRSDQSATR